MTRTSLAAVVLSTLCFVAPGETFPPASTKLLTGFPAIEQTTDYTCGASAMQGVLAYYGKVFTESALAKELGSSPKDGTDHHKMAAFAEKLGIRTTVRHNLELRDIENHLTRNQAVIVEAQAYADAAKAGKPYSEIWDSGHYMIPIGIDDKNLYFVDSSLGLKHGYLPREEFLERWHDLGPKNEPIHRTAILFEGTPRPVPSPAAWVQTP